MIIDSKTKLCDLFYIIDLFKVEEDRIKEILDKIEKTKLPKEYTKDLYSLSLSQLDDLTNSTTDFYSLITVPFKVLYGIEEQNVMLMPAIKTIRTSFYYRDQIKNIVEMFDKIKNKPTSEEIAAGINNISSDFFSICDWYCHRQGISSHDEVANINWVVIYKALKLDFETNNYKMRLQKKHGIKKQK